MADEDKRKHLDLLQAVITRMASNSFVIKGWSIALTTALLGVSAKEAVPMLALLALLPILAFWALDAYYLGLERRFRALYAAAIAVAATDFKMTPAPLGVPGWWEAAVRPAVAGLHLPLALATLGLYWVLKC